VQVGAAEDVRGCLEWINFFAAADLSSPRSVDVRRRTPHSREQLPATDGCSPTTRCSPMSRITDARGLNDTSSIVVKRVTGM
jgi:hypothetical protein